MLFFIVAHVVFIILALFGLLSIKNWFIAKLRLKQKQEELKSRIKNRNNVLLDEYNALKDNADMLVCAIENEHKGAKIDTHLHNTKYWINSIRSIRKELIELEEELDNV